MKLQSEKIQDWSTTIGMLNAILSETWAVVSTMYNVAIVQAMKVALGIQDWIMAFIGMAFLTVDYLVQRKMLRDAKSNIGNSNSVVSNAIKNYIQDLEQQMSDISEAIDILNIKEDNYMNQKISFSNKLNELSNYNKFFKDFNQMNDNIFTQTNIFTTDQIVNWQKEVEKEYGYLTGNSVTTDDFIKAFLKEETDFSNKYFDFQNKEKNFIDNYNNNDKEYFLKNLFLYVDNPLKNNDTYFNSLNMEWNNYDDIFKE